MSANSPSEATLIERWRTVRGRLRADDALVLCGGADLAYLTGYEAMPLERITAWVGRADGLLPELILPGLEAARVSPVPGAFGITGWADDEDPIDRIVEQLDRIGRVLVSDHLWSKDLLALQRHRPDTEFVGIAEALGGVRSIKNPAEVAALLKVGGLVDQVIRSVQTGEVPLVGRTEADIAEEISERVLAVGHDTVSFAIVASGPNSASPHHHPGDRIVEPDEIVLFDIGGTHQGFCSDTTRCVFTGEIPDDVARAYDALLRAQEIGVKASRVGNQLGDVDRSTREVLADAGYGEYFIHRTGHGIGAEAHEEPYIYSANDNPIEVGHAFSVEPGIYIDGRWGMRLEDIVVVGSDGPIRANNTPHELVRVPPDPT